MHYLLLMIAVAMETVGTTALQASNQFTRLWPTLLAIVAYAGSVYFLGLTLKFMPVGIVYALWSGLGIVLITIIGFIVFGQRLDAAAVAGLTMIIAGIIVIQVFSNTTSH
jgi:small multidrug resistance pump